MDLQHLLNLLTIILTAAGAFFLLVGSVGLLRLPDFYTRTHATGKADTLGIMLVITGLIINQGISVNSAKLLIIVAFVGLTNPTATNALARAAYHLRLKPWFKKDKQKKSEKKEKE
ncbi:MAG: monovalent cation/H(+) antiporter subunit G [Candidatus Aminicenantes bacterium]|nr:monovalent cation/H(+) antiporter subunit G [Candidatus Aminicenantes bacterium]